MYRRNAKRRTFRFLIWVAVLAASTILLSSALPTLAQTEAVPLPDLTGTHPVGRSIYQWIDDSRDEFYTPDEDDKRMIEVWTWYPAAPAADAQPAPYLSDGMSALLQMFGVDSTLINDHSYAEAPVAESASPYPVLIFSHGNGSNSAFYASLLEEIASYGYVVFGIDHNYNALLTTLADGQVVPFMQEAADQSDDDFTVRVADMTFVIDQVTALNDGDSPLAGKLNLERIGLLGHSFGGATAAEACRAGEPCKGAAVMDVPLQGEVAATGLSQPILLLDAEKLDCPEFIAEVEQVTGQPAPADFIDFCPQFFAGREESYVAALNTSSAGYHLSIEGSRHGTFGDMGYLLRLQPALQPQMGGFPSIEDDRGWRVSSDLLLSFFDQSLNGGDGTLLTDSSADYPEVVFVGGE